MSATESNLRFKIGRIPKDQKQIGEAEAAYFQTAVQNIALLFHSLYGDLLCKNGFGEDNFADIVCSTVEEVFSRVDPEYSWTIEWEYPEDDNEKE